MTTAFLVIANNQIPVIAFPTLVAAQQFCSGRPDMSYCEFTIPSTLAGREEVKNNLKDLFALKQALGENRVVPTGYSFRGMPNRQAAAAVQVPSRSPVAFPENSSKTAELDMIVEQRISSHRDFLKRVYTALQTDPSKIEGQCPEPMCPGRMAEGMMYLE